MLKLRIPFDPVNDNIGLNDEQHNYFQNGALFDDAYNKFGDKIDEWLKQSIICESKHTGKTKFYLLE